MRWLSLSAGYVHEVVGGTEAYVHRLNLALRRRSVEAFGAYFTAKPTRAELDGVPLVGLPARRGNPSRMEHWACVPHALKEFEALLVEVRPDVVHFHSTLQVHSPEYFELARGAGAKTLWTFHAHGQTCLQTALLRNGTEQCDGRIEPGRCARCGLVWSGLPRPIAAFFGTVDLSSLARRVPARFGHPLERRRGVIEFQRRLSRACASLDHWVVHSRWVRELLAINALDRSVLELPLPPPEDEPVEPDHSVWEGAGSRLRMLYAGRLQDKKGPQIPLDALRGPLRDAAVFYVLLSPRHGTSFEAMLEARVAAEPRARLLPSRNFRGTLAAMAAADVVVVPSLWKETGPYAVLEAQWVGTSVIGARLGGIAERLDGDEWSTAFEPPTPDAFASAVMNLRRDAGLAARRDRARGFRQRYLESFQRALGNLLRVVKSPASVPQEPDTSGYDR